MLSPVILIPAVLNGLMTGAIYALVALGLTLIYGVLHIINFAHGALLSAAMFAAFFAHAQLGLDPYLAAVFLTPLFFLFGYGLQRFLIGPAAHGEDRNFLLVTLGLAIVIENALLYAFRADTRTINLPYAFSTIEVGSAFLAVPRVIAFVAVVAVTAVLWAIMQWTDTGKAIRAVAKEKLGAELRPRDRLRCGGGLLVDPDLLCEPDRGGRLRADRVHHCGSRRHGFDHRRADRRAVRRHRGEPIERFPGPISRPDRHFCDVYRCAAAAPEWPVR
jgi:hypothetical protein